MLPVLTLPTRGANVTWTGAGATTNWNLGANWSTGTPPTAADVAVFDGTSSKVVLVNANINVGGVQVTAAYGGSITQGAGRTITIGASGWDQAGSSFAGSAAAITVNGPFALSGGTFTSTSGILSVAGDLTHGAGTFAHNSGTLRLIGAAAALNLPGALTVWNLALAQNNAAAKTLDPGDVLIVNGTVTLTNGTWEGGAILARGPIAATSGFDGGDGTLRIDGGGDQLVTGTATVSAGELPNLVIDKPSGTLTLAGTIRTPAVPGPTSAAPGRERQHRVVRLGQHDRRQSHPRRRRPAWRGVDQHGRRRHAHRGRAADPDRRHVGRWHVTRRRRPHPGLGIRRRQWPPAHRRQRATSSSPAAPDSTTGQLPAVVIDKPGGTLSLAGTIRTLHDWTYLAGALDAGGSTVVFGGALTISGSHALGGVEFRGANAKTHRPAAPRSWSTSS